MSPQNDEQPTVACRQQARVREFLDSDQYQLGDAELITHLDECVACREYVQALAGDNQQWNEATELLQPTEFDQAGSVEFSAATCGETLAKQPIVVKEVLDSLTPSEDPNHLGRLGNYEITGVVGVGGMGVVLKATDPSLDRVVAVKVMNPRLANNQNARLRFAREAKAAAAVLHPNVVPIHSVSSGSSLPYLVMSYIRGGSLQTRLEQEGPLPLIEVLRIGSQIAAGLHAAHEQGLIHRDIKPENILLEEGVERVTITDFGLARSVDDNTITQFGSIAGTPQYMSPEQARGEQLDQQSDLFSLGSVLYTLCTGRPPFRDETSYGVMRRIIDENPQNISQLNNEVPSWIVSIVETLMSKQKADRYTSAGKVHELLEDCLGHIQNPAGNPLPATLRKRKSFLPKSRTMRIVSGGTLTVLFLFGLFWAYQLTQPYSPARFGTLYDAFGKPVENLPGERPSLTVGRFTVGDQQRLLGSWEVIDVPLRWNVFGKSDLVGQWHRFDKDEYTINTPGRASSKGGWELDTSVSPRRMVLELYGAERKALYKLQGDYLSLFYREGENEFPSQFPSVVSLTESGVLLVLRRVQHADFVFEHRDLTPEEAELLAQLNGDLTFSGVSALTPQLALALASGRGNLNLPSVDQLTPEAARALSTKEETWISLPGLTKISTAAAKELAGTPSALQLGVQELGREEAKALGSRSRSLALNRLTSISPDVASALVRNDGWLQLNGLKTIDAELAAVLSKHPGWLSLDGLEALTPEVAKAMQAFQGRSLDLNGLTTLDIETAKALARAKPTNTLDLNGLKTLSPDVATTLVSGGHRHLSLQGLEVLPEESLQVLRRHQRRLIEGNSGRLILPSKFDLPAVQ